MNQPSPTIRVPVATPEESQVFEAKPVPSPARRRGRPPGSKTTLVNQCVTADEFALMRAVAQGVDLSVAARQYLLWPGRMPETKALLLWFDQLLVRVASAAATLPETERQTALRGLRLLEPAVEAAPVAVSAAEVPVPIEDDCAGTPAPAPAIPTLEEFAAQFDEDMYSESELMELYEEEYGQARAPSAHVSDTQLELAPVAPAMAPLPPSLAEGQDLVQTMGTRDRQQLVLQSISWLEQRLSRQPERAHLLQQWVRFGARQQVALAHAGVITMGDLVDWMALKGAQWYDALPGYGETRAEGLRLWLLRHGLKPSAGLQQVEAAKRAVIPHAGTGLQPLTSMHWPASLNGAQGMFRTFRPNTLKATNDCEAVQAWFAQIKQRSPATQLAYQRAIERLVLWAVHEKHLALSSLSTEDLLEFRAFLASPPPHWVQIPGAERAKFSAEWRPLRGPQKDKSLDQTFAAVGAMYGAWRKADYISANPADQVVGSTRKNLSMDVMRSFSDQQLAVIGKTFDKLADGPAKRRLAAILRLLENAGLRREEVEKARWSHLFQARLDNKQTDQWALKVVGKGNREREVPINRRTFEALTAHREDRIALAASGRLARFASVKPENMPLIGVIDSKWIKTHNAKLAEAALLPVAVQAFGGAGYVPGQRRYSVNDDGGLSASGIYDVLKSFFKRCAFEAGELPTDPHAAFYKASTHWLRHTFAHHVMRATGRDLAVTQSLLGHKDISTTAIYVKADLAARVEAVEKIQGSV